MLKKTREETTDTLEQAKELSQAVLKSSHQIWLAGLGAFARAQQEGMKVFDTLVSQGRQLESRTREAAADTALAARGAASARAKEMQKMAGGTWDKLEQVFEDRVARALSKMGVYTHNDVQRLAERVDALSDAVNRLIRQTPAKRTRAARKSPAQPAAAPGRKRAVKRTAGKAGKRAAT
jgi:poly(hydroxyalkanoate) granule-associated protein